MTDVSSDTWFVNLLRFTVMSSELDALPSADDAWKAVYDDEPHSRSERAPLRLTECRGRKARWSRVVRQVSNRVDVIEEAVVPPDAWFGDFSTLDDHRDVIDRFADSWRRLAREVDLGRATRIALAGQLYRAAPDKEAACQQLDALLPSVEVDPSTSDFSYRINRPRTRDGVKINRVMKWSVMEQRTQVIIGHRVHDTGCHYAVGLEFDINTDGEREDPLGQADIVDFAEGLRGELERISAHGEKA